MPGEVWLDYQGMLPVFFLVWELGRLLRVVKVPPCLVSTISVAWVLGLGGSTHEWETGLLVYLLLSWVHAFSAVKIKDAHTCEL